MDLRHLRTFLRVYGHRSLSAAALEMGVSQPALSKVLRRLESEFGVPLFDRLPRGLEPTEYGNAFAEAARSIDTNYRLAIRQIDAMRDAKVGELAIGAGATWRDRLLPEAVAAFLSKRPAVRVKVETGSSDAILSALVDGGIDLAFVPIPEDPPFPREMRTEILITDTLVVVARAGHRLAGRKDVPLAELARQRWAMATGRHVSERFRGLFGRHGIDPPAPAVATEDTNCMLDIVSRSDLLAYVPRLRVKFRLGTQLAVIPSRQAQAKRSAGVVMRSRTRATVLQQEFLVEMKRVVARSG
jgi:DNA-binding transcriptional LysR family regulator